MVASVEFSAKDAEKVRSSDTAIVWSAYGMSVYTHISGWNEPFLGKVVEPGAPRDIPFLMVARRFQSRFFAPGAYRCGRSASIAWPGFRQPDTV